MSKSSKVKMSISVVRLNYYATITEVHVHNSLEWLRKNVLYRIYSLGYEEFINNAGYHSCRVW